MIISFPYSMANPYSVVIKSLHALVSMISVDCHWRTDNSTNSSRFHNDHPSAGLNSKLIVFVLKQIFWNDRAITLVLFLLVQFEVLLIISWLTFNLESMPRINSQRCEWSQSTEIMHLLLSIENQQLSYIHLINLKQWLECLSLQVWNKVTFLIEPFLRTLIEIYIMLFVWW